MSSQQRWITEAAKVECLERDDWEHHDATDDFPCTACTTRATDAWVRRHEPLGVRARYRLLRLLTHWRAA